MGQPQSMFMEKWVEDSARNRVVREIDPMQSEYPAHTGSAIASGTQTPDAGNAEILLSIPSAMWYKPRTLWLNNYGAANDKIVLFAGGSNASCSATLGMIQVPGNDTAMIALDGITVGTDLWASGNLGSIFIRVGGILIASGPENS